MKRAATHTRDENEADAERLAEMLLRLYEMPQMTLALVHGTAMGGGFELALEWMAEGKLRSAEDIQHGLENAPATLRRLFEGKNFGKQLVKLA